MTAALVMFRTTGTCDSGVGSTHRSSGRTFQRSSAAARHGWPAWVDGVVVACVSLLVGAVRTYDHVPFWLDEAVTAHLVDRPFSAVVDIIGTREAGMGPYYVALWCWTRLGTSDEWIRMFSVVGAAVAVLVCHRLALRWFGRTTAVVVAVVLMVHPTVLRYQTEARAYSWIMACGVGVVLAAIRLRRVRTTGAAALLGLVIGLAVAMHVVLVVFIVVMVGVWWWCDTDRGWWADRRFSACPLAAAAGLAPFTWPFVATADQVDWIPKPTIGEIRGVATELFGGTLFDGRDRHRRPDCHRSRRERGDRRRDARLIAPLTIALIPVMMVAVLSLTVKPLFLARYMVAAVPFRNPCRNRRVLARTAEGPSSRPGRRRGAVARGLPGARSVRGCRARPDDMKAVTDYLADNLATGDVVLFEPVAIRVSLHWYGGVDPRADVGAPTSRNGPALRL